MWGYIRLVLRRHSGDAGRSSHHPHIIPQQRLVHIIVLILPGVPATGRGRISGLGCPPLQALKLPLDVLGVPSATQGGGGGDTMALLVGAGGVPPQLRAVHILRSHKNQGLETND